MSKLFAVFIAIIIGIAAGIQPAMNANLGKISSPKSAALLNFLLGGLIFLAFTIITGGLKEFALVAKAPWYLWLGGLLGILIVTGAIYVVPVIGTGATLAIIVALQLTMGMVVDHFGWFGVPKVPIDIARVLGLIVLALGVRLIIK